MFNTLCRKRRKPTTNTHHWSDSLVTFPAGKRVMNCSEWSSPRRGYFPRNRFFDFTLPSSNTNQRQVGPNAKKQVRDDSEVRGIAKALASLPSAREREREFPSFNLGGVTSWSTVRYAIRLLYLFGWAVLRLHQWTNDDRTQWHLHSCHATLSRTGRFATAGEIHSSSGKRSLPSKIFWPWFVLC